MLTSYTHYIKTVLLWMGRCPSVTVYRVLCIILSFIALLLYNLSCFSLRFSVSTATSLVLHCQFILQWSRFLFNKDRCQFYNLTWPLPLLLLPLLTSLHNSNQPNVFIFNSPCPKYYFHLNLSLNPLVSIYCP